MTSGSVAAIVRALNASGARYLVVGGLAVVAHGYVRFTADLDLVLDLSPDNLQKALVALGALGYRPRAPVDLMDFGQADHRATWIREKGLTVFSLFSAEHQATEIDLFVESPFDFDRAYTRAARMEVSTGVVATVVGLNDLITLKERAARPQDALDLAQLRQLRDHPSDDG